MRQRGRKSAAELEVISVDGSPSRLLPPDHLGADEHQRFTEIVSNSDARHFRPSDTPLLSRFVEADTLAEKAPQSRIDARGLGRQEARLTVNPWEWNGDDARR